jgi:hypothetical protein
MMERVVVRAQNPVDRYRLPDLVVKRLVVGTSVELLAHDRSRRVVQLGPAKLVLCGFDDMQPLQEKDGYGLWVFAEERFRAFDMALVDHAAKTAYLIQVTVSKPFDSRHRKQINDALRDGHARTQCDVLRIGRVVTRSCAVDGGAERIVSKLLEGSESVLIEQKTSDKREGPKAAPTSEWFQATGDFQLRVMWVGVRAVESTEPFPNNLVEYAPATSMKIMMLQ